MDNLLVKVLMVSRQYVTVTVYVYLLLVYFKVFCCFFLKQLFVLLLLSKVFSNRVGSLRSGTWKKCGQLRMRRVLRLPSFSSAGAVLSQT